MRTMWSLALMPMRMAGVSGMGFLTVMRPLRSISMTMPRPPNLPWVVVRMSLKLSTSSKTECGSSV
jgi:hypothetical protein